MVAWARTAQEALAAPCNTSRSAKCSASEASSSPFSDSPASLNFALQSRWKAITYSWNCLHGLPRISQEDLRRGKFSEGVRKEFGEMWASFLEADRSSLEAFLTEKLRSQRSTFAHTCVYQLAREGELAVYMLQQLNSKSWLKYDGENELIRDSISDYRDETKEYWARLEQGLLWTILEDEDARLAIARYLVGKGENP